MSQTASPYPVAADFLASKVYWTIRVATDSYQVRWALDLITAFVNKRVNGEYSSRQADCKLKRPELEGALEGILEQIWLSDVQDTSGDYEVRRRGLLVYLHVCCLTIPRLTADRQGSCAGQTFTCVYSFR